MDSLEEQFDAIEGKLYQMNHWDHIPSIENNQKGKEFWDSIKGNRDLLEWATTVRRDKWNQKNTFCGTTICEAMLIDHNDVDKDLYNSLISKIYADKDLARIVLKGASNGGWSFLLLALQNKDYVLTEEQKAFAIDEAMNMHGTTRYSSIMDEFERELDSNNVTDEETVIVDFGSGSHPVGKKSCVLYMRNLLNDLDSSQAHGRGAFDIRYHILHNPNWSDEDKRHLVHDFWADNEEYAQTLDDWEWEIINDSATFTSNSFVSELNYYELYDYKKDDLMAIYQNKDTVDYIMSEIDFCRKMKEFRPMCDIWESNLTSEQ